MNIVFPNFIDRYQNYKHLKMNHMDIVTLTFK